MGKLGQDVTRAFFKCIRYFLIGFRLLWKHVIKPFYLWILLIPVGIALAYQIITGITITIGSTQHILINIFTVVAAAVVIMKNIEKAITAIKKEKFTFIGLLLKKKEKQGFVAKLDGVTVALRTANDLSGVVFGKQGGKYAVMPETTDGHALIVGGAGSGKTSAIAIPTLMSWKERVFSIDIKGELFEKTKKTRNEAHIKVFNPTDRNASGYDPYFMLKKSDDVSSEARQLAMSICPLSAEVKDPFWIKGAQNMLTGFIVYLYGQGLSFSESMHIIKSQPVKQLVALIMESGDSKAITEISQFDGMDDKTLSGVFSELSNHITVFATSEDLQRALSGEGPCITPQDLEDGYDIYCCIPEHKLDEWKDLLGMMCNQFLRSFERRGEDKKTPILFLIDEFPRLGKIETICNGLATLRSKKIHIALFVQSKSQLNAIYGKDIAEVIADNCSYKAILKASEPNTQEWCSKLVGTYEKAKTTTSWKGDIYSFREGKTSSLSTEEKRIIKPEEFSYLQDVVCLFPNGYRRIEKIKYWEDKTFA